MSRTRIRAILSDWGRVVVHFDNRRSARAFAPHSLLATPTELLLYERLFKDCRELFELYMRGLVSTTQFRYLVRNVLRLDKDCNDAAFDAAFGDVFDWNMPMVEFQQARRVEGVRLTAVSNVEEIRHARLRKMGIDELFDVLNLSYRLKLAKPDPEFLLRAIEATGVPAKESLYLDDHEEFTDVGRSLSLQTWTYLPERHAEFLAFAETLEFLPAHMR